MRYLITLLCALSLTSLAAQLTISVDVSCSFNPNPTEVRMTGAFWGWDPAGGPVATNNGDGTWSVTFDPAPTADMEYKWLIDGTWEDLIDDMQSGGSCAPVTDFFSYANRLWTVGSPGTTDTYGQCSACTPLSEGCNPASLVCLTFDDASSITSWQALADGASSEASLAWNATGVTTGALDISGTNTSTAGKAYIFQYLDGAVDYEGSTSVQLSFDIKLSGPLSGAAVHMQTEFPGTGSINTFDIQNSGINENTWTTLTYNFNGIGAGSLFRIHFNIAAGAFVGAGGGLLVDNIQLLSTGTASPDPLTLNLEYCGATPTSVRMTGPFWGWDPNGGPVATANGDGTWSVVLDPAPTANMEYLWVVDGVQENLIQDMIDGGSCAPVTDYANYANRLWTVGSPDTNDTYDQCTSCNIAGCTDPNAANYDPNASTDDGSCGYNVSFSVDMNEYVGTIGFVNVSGTWNGWCADCNQLTDADLDGVWEATIAIPNGAHQFKYQIDGWVDQENLMTGMSCTITQGSFTNRTLDVAGAAQTLDVVCFGSCFACQTGETPGCNDATAVNYDPAATVNNGTCQYNVTFRVDMQQYVGTYGEVDLNGSFNGWCGQCAFMDDTDGDLVFELTVLLTDGYYEYKFTTDGFTDQENFNTVGGCITENFGFFNRYIQVTGNAVLDVVCWNSCEACITNETFGCTDVNAANYNANATADDGSCVYTINFSVDMNNYGAGFGTVYVAGAFNGWCGACNPLADGDGDGVWQGSVNMPAGAQEYKFVIDDWAAQEQFVGGESCTITTGGFTNRLINVSGSAVVPVVCWESCIACPSVFYTITFRVDMANQTVDANGVHIAGSFQGWDAASTSMTYLGYGIYEFESQFGSGSVLDYKFINGNDFAGAELVPAACGTDDGFGAYNRSLTVTGDATILVCFGECDACAGCTDPFSVEYNPFAGSDNGSCATPIVMGCTYSDATNYNAAANDDDGSCMFNTANPCPADLNGDAIINAADLLEFLGSFGTVCIP